MDFNNSKVMDAVKADMQERTFYWTGDKWLRVPPIQHIDTPAVALKGSVKSFDLLPSFGNKKGDMYVVEPASPVMAFAGMGASDEMAPVTLLAPGTTCNAVLKGEQTLRGVVTGVLMEPTTGHIARGLPEVIRRYVLTKLLDEKLVLVVSDDREPVLMARGAALESGLSVVKAIEVNKLSVVTTSGIDTFGVVLSYDGRRIRIDSSAY
jgi:hypothetical protein